MSDFLERFDEQIHTIPQALYNSAASFGGRPANLFKEDKWQIVTYSELVNKVENIALGLIKLGLQAGDLVGIKAHTSARWTWAD
ncbi:MAG TPA: AMP-binding protein, partial [Syntrophomonadaceae bacterium]|nr:AMP-binding protein [Syntrophomonadaceae bacterium]